MSCRSTGGCSESYLSEVGGEIYYLATVSGLNFRGADLRLLNFESNCLAVGLGL